MNKKVIKINKVKKTFLPSKGNNLQGVTTKGNLEPKTRVKTFL